MWSVERGLSDKERCFLSAVKEPRQSQVRALNFIIISHLSWVVFFLNCFHYLKLFQFQFSIQNSSKRCCEVCLGLQVSV